MNKLRFVGILCPLVEIKKPTVFHGLSFQTMFTFKTTALFSRYGTEWMEGRKKGKSEETKGGK